MKDIRATKPLAQWRTIDLLTCAFLGVAFGIAYWAWGKVYEVPSNAISAGFPPLSALFAWPWLVAGIVGMLVVRRPGAALFTEILAAIVSMVPGTQWGSTVFWSGFFQGLGVEIGFALFAYAGFRLLPTLVAGFLGGAVESVYEWYSYWTDWDMGYKIAHLFLLGAATAVLGGLLSHGIVRGLASAGALNSFPPGQEQWEARRGVERQRATTTP